MGASQSSRVSPTSWRSDRAGGGKYSPADGEDTADEAAARAAPASSGMSIEEVLAGASRSTLSRLKRRDLTQMPLREALPVAASYLEAIKEQRNCCEDERELLVRVCQLLQSSRMADALSPAVAEPSTAVTAAGVMGERLRTLSVETEADHEMRARAAPPTARRRGHDRAALTCLWAAVAVIH